jgi:hypothetical protein
MNTHIHNYREISFQVDSYCSLFHLLLFFLSHPLDVALPPLDMDVNVADGLVPE